VAIAPPSDIVLGVALAADPQKYRAAAARLQRLGEAAGDFETVVRAAGEPRRTGAPPAASASVAAATPARPTRGGGNGDVFTQLEAFVLQSFIQSMLPKSSEHTFGKGFAGDVWKSMLAEQLAGEIARSGRLGLAERLAAGRSGPVAGGADAARGPSVSLTQMLVDLQAQGVAGMAASSLLDASAATFEQG
jgi:hypothetical protein